MSTGPIEVAEEALQKLDELEIVDQKSKDKAEKARGVRLTNEEQRKIWEEKQALKPVLEKSVKGKVKWYSVRGKYGFITREDGKDNIFVHQSAISKSPIVRYYLRTLADDEEVVFDVVEGDKGPEAANVTGPDGAEVQGSRYYYTLINGRFTRRGESRPEREKKESPKGEEEEEGKDDEKKKKPKRHNRNRRDNRKTEKKADADAEEESPKGEQEEEGKGDEKKKKKKPNRQNRNRRDNRKTEKKADADAEEASSKADAEGSEEMEAKAPSRRRVSSENDTPKKEKKKEKVASPKGSGDASLAVLPTDTAVVC